MKKKQNCPKCKGSGKRVVESKTTCPACKGLGSTKIVVGSKPTNNCSKCSGTGKIIQKSEIKCSSCKGTGIEQKYCIICDNSLSNRKLLCEKCENNPIIHQLVPPVSNKSVGFKKIYISKIVKKTDFGYFVQLAPKVEGLIRDKKLKGKEGDILYVKLLNTKGGKLEFQRINLQDTSVFSIKRIHDEVSLQKIQTKRDVGSFLTIIARVENVRQIPRGPKVFTLLDETGMIEAAAFQLDFIEEIKTGDIVEVMGQYTLHRGAEQIEIADIFIVEEAYANAFIRKMDEMLDSRSSPPDIDFLIKSDILEILKPKFVTIARRIRKALLELQPIVIRHHNDCDGISAGIALEVALGDLWTQFHGSSDEDQLRHIVKRTVNKPPFYDPLDAVRDLNFALEDQERFGDKIPLIVMLDTGSSEESLFSYKLLKTYGIEVMVVDHHFPASVVQDTIETHLNVYHAGGDYNICTGMLGVELARFVNSNITNIIKHLPSIAGMGDRVQGSEFNQYLGIAREEGYTDDFLTDIAIAVDYQAYFLKFSPGRFLLSDLLGISGKQEKQIKYVNLLAGEAKILLANQLQISLEYVEEDTLANGIRLAILDVENYANRFDYPPPGKITGSLFDNLAKKDEKSPLVTIGLGPDFAIFRSQHVKLDFPKLVKTCAERIPYAGVDGGGHEIVGSMKFITGARIEMIKLIKELLTLIEISIGE
ncbi:MAG: zinc finger domain-containing protein [Candidatus Hodarchaeota archaeon]